MTTAPQHQVPVTPDNILHPFLTPTAATEFQDYLSSLELPATGDQLPQIPTPIPDPEDDEDYGSLYSLSSKYTLRAIIDYAFEQGWILTTEEANQSLDEINIAMVGMAKYDQELQKKRTEFRKSREEIKAEKADVEKKRVHLQKQEKRLQGVLKTIEKQLEALTEERRQLGTVESFQCLRCQCQLQGRVAYVSYTPVQDRRTGGNDPNGQVLVTPKLGHRTQDTILADKERWLLEWETTLMQQQAAFENTRKAKVDGISPAMADTGNHVSDTGSSSFLRSTPSLMMAKKVKWCKRLLRSWL
ncbi:hypothetical protein L211DRAFT_881633 [Terfezia boudieri ATCC MYA-4762]|uniref:Uncharacterized protein n=1 Tax=Terfezia boudieri ATCC MYA-4762 TaxID=1051890 RepID=A0A3N4M1K3_9PEZI|nr:hypothetical protein L211DRAFT_881633 [Terfezia boudieri ATCC MYA-4762]